MGTVNPNYFFVNRGLLHSERWLSEPFTRGQAWVDLFGLAQFHDGFFRVRGIKVAVKRGQLAYSQLTLAKRWRWSRGKVIRYLNELEIHGDLVQQTNKVTTLITVLKYDEWQGGNTTSSTTDGQQTDNKRYTYKNDKNDKNDKTESLPVDKSAQAKDLIDRAKGYTADDPRWPEMVGKLRMLRYEPRLDADRAIFVEGRWKVKGDQGWVEWGLGVKGHLHFVNV